MILAKSEGMFENEGQKTWSQREQDMDVQKRMFGKEEREKRVIKERESGLRDR